MKSKKKIKALFCKFSRLANYSQQPTGPVTALLTTTEETSAIQSLCYADLKYGSTNLLMGFYSHVKMANLAYHYGCNDILEIGAGLSTAIWARFAERTGARVTAIDLDFRPMTSLLKDTDHEASVAENVELVSGATITSDELIDFFTYNSHETFGGIKVADFVDNLEQFRDRRYKSPKSEEVAALALRRNWSIRDLVTTGSTIIFPRQLLDLFSSGKNFDNEVALLKELEPHGKAGVLEGLISQRKQWDLIFFDSGELSSMIEWLKLKNHIAVGGLAAFHDIFFPKSFKNFIVCASIMADPNWKVVFIDNSTKQGLMIAQRLA